MTAAARAAIYARVSSKGQRDRQTIESQLRDVPAYCAAMGWSVVKTYVDDGLTAKSGHLDKRVGMMRLLDDAEAGVFDVVAVIDVDRLTRSEDHIERHYITGRLQRAGVKVASPSSGVLDMDTFAGDVMIGMKTAMSAEWLRNHRTRIKAGKLTAIGRNRKPAGPTPYGWSYSRETGAWSIDEHQSAVVLEVLRRVAGGESCYEIALDLDRRAVPRPRGARWGTESVWKIARSTSWLGSWVADKRRGLAIAVPPIATIEQHEAALAALARHRRHRGPRGKHCHLLSRIATCALCSQRVGVAAAEPSSNIRAAYVCTHRRRPLPGADPCRLRRHPVDATDAAVWEAVADAINSERIAKVLLGREPGSAPSMAGQAEAARADLARLDRARSVALSHHAAGRIDDRALADQLERLQGLERAARGTLMTVERGHAADSPDDPDAVARALEALQAACAAAGPERRRQIIRTLVGRVVVGDDRVVVDLRLPAAWIVQSLSPGTSSQANGRSAGQVIVLLPRPPRPSKSPDPEADAAVARAVAQAQVTPPAYLRPAKVVGGAVKSRSGHPLELRACACCRQTFWAQVNGPNPATFCSHRCYDASGGRWARHPAA